MKKKFFANLWLTFHSWSPLKPIRLYCTAYYWIFKSKKIFGAFQHQKFYLLSINNSFGFLLNILNEEIIKDTRSTKLINITT